MKILIITLTLLTTTTLQAKVLSCVGTEPFWGATINLDNGVVKIDEPSIEKGIAIKTVITSAAGTAGDYAFVAKGKHTSMVVMHNTTCTDGMSEETYTHSVMMIGYKSQPWFGCCKEK